MSRYHGPQQPGAARQQRERRRLEAEVRNALTPPHRRARRSQRAELITWCRIFGINTPCAKPCDDCRRTSRLNAQMPDDIRVTMAAVRAEREAR